MPRGILLGAFSLGNTAHSLCGVAFNLHSEEKMSPELFTKALELLKKTGVFDVVSGVLVGKPMDEAYIEEYRYLLIKVIDRPELPIVYNLNIGHATPHCIIPFGIKAVVDAEKQVIRFSY